MTLNIARSKIGFIHKQENLTWIQFWPIQLCGKLSSRQAASARLYIALAGPYYVASCRAVISCVYTVLQDWHSSLHVEL